MTERDPLSNSRIHVSENVYNTGGYGVFSIIFKRHVLNIPTEDRNQKFWNLSFYQLIGFLQKMMIQSLNNATLRNNTLPYRLSVSVPQAIHDISKSSL